MNVIEIIHYDIAWSITISEKMGAQVMKYTRIAYVT